MKKTYTVKIAKSDSVTNVEYTGVLHAWWQEGGTVFALEMGERNKDRSYIYYPSDHIDHVHVIEDQETGE